MIETENEKKIRTAERELGVLHERRDRAAERLAVIQGYIDEKESELRCLRRGENIETIPL